MVRNAKTVKAINILSYKDDWTRKAEKNKQIKSSLYSRDYAKACYEWGGGNLRDLAPGQYNCEETSQIAAVTNRWRRCVRVDRHGNGTPDLPHR